MSNSTLLSLIALGVLGVLALFVLNFSNYIPVSLPGITKIFSKEEVRGMAVSHNNILFTLNYEQQNQVVDFLNRAVAAKEDAKKTGVVPIQKIVIYPFGGEKPIEILPVSFDEANNLLFLYKEKLMQDTSKGKLKEVLTGTYDP